MANSIYFLHLALSALIVLLSPAVTANNLLKDKSPTGQSQRPAYSMTAEVVNTTSVSLKWTPTSSAGQDGGSNDDTTCPVRLFLIRLKQDGSQRVRTWKVDGSRSSVSLHGLLSGTTYYVRIVAVVCDGRSKPSKWVNVRTAAESASQRAQEEPRETVVPGQPVDVTTRALPDSVFVSWKSPEGGAPVRGYVIGYGEGVPDVSWQYVEATRRNFTIRNLKKATQYVVSVRAFNNVGKGPVVFDLVYTTDSSSVMSPLGTNPLTPPTNLHSKVLSSTTIWLQWTDPSLGRQQVVTDSRYYNVHYQAVQPMGKALSAVARDLNVILYNLSPATRYEFKVRTVRDAQTSHYSTIIANRTFETVPSSAPRDVKVVSLNDDATSVRVSWRHPRHANGNITEYLVFYTWNEALPSEKWQIKPVFGPYTETTLYGLNASSTTFYFRVQARNMHGYGPKSDIVKFTIEQTSTERRESTTTNVVINGNNFTSTTPSIVIASGVNSSTNGDIEDSEDEQDNIDDDVDNGDAHYDYIESAKPANSDVTESSSTQTEANVTSSDSPSGALKSKRVPSLLSPGDDGTADHDPQPVASQPSSTAQRVAFRATVNHHVSVFITWPASESCSTSSPRRSADAVVGYQLRYKAATPDGDNSGYVTRYMTENVALLEGLAPNKKYKYQLRYVRRNEKEIRSQTDYGWSQEAEFDTGAG